MKFRTILTNLCAAIIALISCTNAGAHTGLSYSHNQGIVSGGEHTDILMDAPEFIETRVAGGHNFYVEGDDIVVRVNLRNLDDTEGMNALVSEGGAASVIHVTETGQSSFQDASGRPQMVDLVQDGVYGIYVYPDQSTGIVRIPIRRNNHPNMTSTITVTLDHSRSWGIEQVSTARVSIDIDDNTQNQLGGPLVVAFCPDMLTEVQEGQNFQILLCLNRAADANIAGQFLILPEQGENLDLDLDGEAIDFTFYPGETRVEHSVPIYTDAVLESDEQFDVFVELTTQGVLIESDLTHAHTVTIKDATRVHLALKSSVVLDATIAVDNPDYDDMQASGPDNEPYLERTARVVQFSLDPSYPDSTDGNTCTYTGEGRRNLPYTIRFSTSTGQDFLQDPVADGQDVDMSYGECASVGDVLVTIGVNNDLYGEHVVTMEVLDDSARLTAAGAVLKSQTSFPQGRTKTFTVDFGDPPPPPPPTAAEIAAAILAAGPSIVTVSADKSEVEEGGSVTLTFTRSHAMGTHTRRITIGADSNINVIKRYGGCNSSRGVICVLLGDNLPVPTSLRFDPGVDTLEVVLYITNDDYIYSAGTISATVSQGTADAGNTVSILLVDTDEETVTEYTAIFSPVERCVVQLDVNGRPIVNSKGVVLTVCSRDSAYQIHDGKWGSPVEVPIEFSAEPNPMSYRDMIDRVSGGRRTCGVVSAENGTLIGARREGPPSNKKWVVKVRPETGAKDIIVRVHRNGNPDSACHTRKIVQFGGDRNMRLARSITHHITRPPQITIADVTVREEKRTLQCTLIHHDVVFDENNMPVLDAEGEETTTERIENFERTVPPRFLLVAKLDKRAANALTLYFNEPAGWTDDVGYGYVPLPANIAELPAEEAAAVIHEAECRNRLYSGGGGERYIRLDKGQSSAARMITVYPDDIDEGNEIYNLEFHFKVRGAPGGQVPHEGIGGYLADNEVRITIENSDPIPKEWVANFSHSVGKTIVRNVSSRLGVLRETGEGETGTWVSLDHDSFSNGPLNGNAEGFMVGMDRSWDTFDAGFAISSSQGTGTFKDVKLGGELLGVYPYVQVQPEDHYSVWGTAGMSHGDITVREGEKEGYTTNMSMTMGAAGVHWRLTELMGAEIAFESDLMFVKAQSDAVRDMKAAKTSSRRLHMALSGTRDWKFETFRVTSGADLGVVHEAGDVQEGYGTEGSVHMGLHHKHMSARVRLGTSKTNGGNDSHSTSIAGSVQYDWLGDSEGVVASYKPTMAMFGDQESYGSTAKLGYGVRRNAVLWMPYVLQSSQQRTTLGMNVKYREGRQLQLEGSQDRLQATLRAGW